MEKPKCVLVGTDGNVFSVLGRVSKALKLAGMEGEAKECQRRVMKAESYDEALQIIMEYIEAE